MINVIDKFSNFYKILMKENTMNLSKRSGNKELFTVE
jgi:hypothetical protein